MNTLAVMHTLDGYPLSVYMGMGIFLSAEEMNTFTVVHTLDGYPLRLRVQ